MEPAWHPLVHCLDTLGPDEIAARDATARRVLREQGIACHVPGGADAPWELDILPLVISSTQWQIIESGLVQRARLLNRLLGDLYGSQHTLREGWLPAPLLYANPSYQRPCQGVRVPDGNYLPFYAADLARSADGRWWVLADRTQNPAGLAFALENRDLLSRVLPEAIQTLRPRPLDGALPLLRETLARISPSQRESPTVVVLTPGPRNEAYFEHTYLARKLCCTLAEGGDLTVRDRRVYLKTLEGLRPVDVILRRVNDAYCDPLEFRNDSLLGVPGLLEAVRGGRVALANALGCGLVESPALLAFLPSLCRRLLDEELLLPSVATWWCGGARELEEVQAREETLALRPAWPLGAPPERCGNPAKNLFRASPQEYVGQEEVILSRAPSFRDGEERMEPYYLRVFLVGDGRSYHLLPGGLVRMPGRERLTTSLFPLSQRSKDAWVLGEGTQAPEPARVSPPSSEHTFIDLPSRAADNLFWLGRYAERLEHIARTVRCALACHLEAGGAARFAAVSGLCEWLGLRQPGEPPLPALLDLISSPSRPGGVGDLTARMHLAAFAVRDRLSADTWRLLNRLPSRPETAPANPLDAVSTLDTLVLDLAAFSGMEMENMTRGHGWLFLDFGRRLERAGNLLSLVRAVIRQERDADLLLRPLLEICDSLITFRQRYFAAIRLPDVLDLLLFQRDNPRSLAFQLEALDRAAASLPKALNPDGAARVCWETTALSARARAMNLDAGGPVPRLDGKPLGEELTSFSSRLWKVSDFLTQTYFSHSIPRVS